MGSTRSNRGCLVVVVIVALWISGAMFFNSVWPGTDGDTPPQGSFSAPSLVFSEAPAPPTVPSNCTPGYSPCLPPAYDYDCRGGSGDGPAYTGRVYVTGADVYGLDRDGDGVGCD